MSVRNKKVLIGFGAVLVAIPIFIFGGGTDLFKGSIEDISVRICGRSDVECWQAKVDAANVEVTRLKDEILRLETQRSQAARDVESKQIALNIAQQKVNGIKAKIELIKKKIEETRRTNLKLVLNKKARQQRLTALANKLAVAQTEFKKAENNRISSMSQLNNARTRLTNINQGITDAGKVVREAEENLNMLKIRLLEAQQRVQEQEEILEEMPGFSPSETMGNDQTQEDNSQNYAEPYPYPLFDELEIDPVNIASDDGKVTVTIPRGYEALGPKALADLQYCYGLIPQFIKTQPYYDSIIFKIFISKDGTNMGSYGSGRILFKRSQENIDMDLRDVQTNSPEGFFYKSSPTYCSNSHEFSHFITSNRPMPWGLSEGIAEYTQKFTQTGSKDDNSCEENGWRGFDIWGDRQLKLFPYDFFPDNPDEFGVGTKIYMTGLCFWELFDQRFGQNKREQIFQRLNEYVWHPNQNAVTHGDTTINVPDGTIPDKLFEKIFIEDIMFDIVEENDAKLFLEKFGYQFPLASFEHQ